MAHEITERSAWISPDEFHRYSLGRRWEREDGEHGRMVYVMLNPSTADALEDDPTIRRCMSFADSYGCSAITVVNLYSLRSTVPKGLENGPHAGRAIYEAAGLGDVRFCVAAWGSTQIPGIKERSGEVTEVLITVGRRGVFAFGRNRDGSPKHPLYLKRDTVLVPYS